MAYFPMFVDLTGKKCLVVGGGRIALRKVQVLLDFEAQVHVIAKEISPEIRELGTLIVEEREFRDSDIDGAFMVVVATGDTAFNERVSRLCRDRNVPVNVVDDKDKCSFIFSSYVKEKNLVGAFTSGGNSPVLAQYLRDKAKDFLTPQLGELGEVFGQVRPLILEKFGSEKERKKVFEHFISDTVSSGRASESREITEYIEGIRETNRWQ